MTSDNIPASPQNTRSPRIALVVARADNGVIGKDGKLPWHIPADLQFFKRVTLGKPVIMGRKTYESIGKPLPRRTNIVLTRNQKWNADGVLVAHRELDALALAYEDAHRTGVDEIMIIGGAEVAYEFMPKISRIYLTEVHRAYDGDTKLEFDMADWKEGDRQEFLSQDTGAPAFSIVTLERAK